MDGDLDLDCDFEPAGRVVLSRGPDLW
jgi:hypothetical protein